MILPDAAIWIDHLHRPNIRLSGYLAEDRVLAHPSVTGEIALGSIAERARTLRNLRRLPQVRVAPAEHVATLIEAEELWSRGIGYVDAHLLAAALLTPGTSLWTTDRRLRAQAERLGVALPAG